MARTSQVASRRRSPLKDIHVTVRIQLRVSLRTQPRCILSLSLHGRNNVCVANPTCGVRCTIVRSETVGRQKRGFLDFWHRSLAPARFTTRFDTGRRRRGEVLRVGCSGVAMSPQVSLRITCFMLSSQNVWLWLISVSFSTAEKLPADSFSSSCAGTANGPDVKRRVTAQNAGEHRASRYVHEHRCSRGIVFSVRRGRGPECMQGVHLRRTKCSKRFLGKGRHA